MNEYIYTKRKRNYLKIIVLLFVLTPIVLLLFHWLASFILLKKITPSTFNATPFTDILHDSIVHEFEVHKKGKFIEYGLASKDNIYISLLNVGYVDTSFSISQIIYVDTIAIPRPSIGFLTLPTDMWSERTKIGFNVYNASSFSYNLYHLPIDNIQHIKMIIDSGNVKSKIVRSKYRIEYKVLGKQCFFLFNDNNQVDISYSFPFVLSNKSGVTPFPSTISFLLDSNTHNLMVMIRTKLE